MKRSVAAALASLTVAATTTALAQDMPGMAMPGMETPTAPPAPAPSAPASAEPAPHLHPAAQADHMAGMAMPGMVMSGMSGGLGDYPATRDASGTAWQPDSTPMAGLHLGAGHWSVMLHGYGTLIYDHQGGPRGAAMTFSESMLMAMAQRPLGGGELGLRVMISLDPLMGREGYPLLLQTGETADGRHLLVDRQHPHDLIMELAATYSHPLAEGLSGFVYFGLPGEPALGPATYMHRFAGMANPETPIGHHWLDSTHVTFGVATAGLVRGPFKLEGSVFTGREPDQNRYDFDGPRFDSWSVRLTWNPAPDWSLQVSRGWIRSPEQLEPDVNQTRTTASATYNHAFAWRGRRGDWQTTFAWGRDRNSPGRTSDAFLLESAATLGRNTLFGRFESVAKDELFANQPASPLAGRAFNVSKLSLGAYRTFPLGKPPSLDLGGLVSRYALPAALDASYGADPTSVMLFARVKLGG